MIVAPHPDDETIGAGGVAALHVRAGDSVAIVSVTNGGGSRAARVGEAEMARLRSHEARAAAEALGVIELHWLNLPEWSWEDVELRRRLLEIVPEADIVYAPSCVDYHPEHVRVARVLASVLRPGQIVRVCELGVPLTPLLVNRVADVEEAAEAKARALSAFRTQAATLAPVVRLAGYRARLYGRRAAEAFWELDAAAYAKVVECGNWTRGTTPYRGLNGRAVLDPLAAIAGLRARLALRRIVSRPPDSQREAPGRGEPSALAAGWLLLLALLVVLPAGAIAIAERFDGLYGQDPFGYFTYATGPLREALLRLEPPPPFFWPPVYPVLVAVVSLLLGPVALAGQLVSLLAGGLVPVFTALLAREVWTPTVARSGTSPHGDHSAAVPVIAGLAAALTGQLWQSSTVVMADTTGLALATAGVWALARYGRRRTAAWLLLAAALLACATLTRWIYGVVAIPCTLYALLVLAGQPRRTAALHAAGAATCVLVILGPALAPAVVPLLQQADEVAPFAGNFQVYSWNPLRALAREFTTADGLLLHDRPNLIYYGLAPARWAFFTPLLAPLPLLGLLLVVRRRTPVILFLILGWAAVVLLFHVGAPYQNFRFTLAYLPPLAILLAIGADRVLRLESATFRRPVLAAVALGFILMAVAGTHTTRTLIARKNEYLATVRWALERMPADARVLAFGISLTFRHYGGLEVDDLWDLDPGTLASRLAAGRPTFLIADTANLTTQWRERAPGTNYRWLEAGPGLTLVGERDGFSLFQVNPGGAPQDRSPSSPR